MMRINTLFYSIKQGFKNIFRNKMFSLASIATMAACIFMFGLFYIVVTNFSSMVKTAEEGVAVTVFFNEGTTEDVIKADKAQIEKRAEVGKVDYQSAAWMLLLQILVFLSEIDGDIFLIHCMSPRLLCMKNNAISLCSGRWLCRLTLMSATHGGKV